MAAAVKKLDGKIDALDLEGGTKPKDSGASMLAPGMGFFLSLFVISLYAFF